MGVQVCIAEEKFALVLWGRVLWTLDDTEPSQADRAEEKQHDPETWLSGLTQCDLSVSAYKNVPFHLRRWAFHGLILGGTNPVSAGSPIPAAPATVYGHLPYLATTGKDDVFYRCEPFPTSRRVLPGPRRITAGTFAAPISELPFMTTGFSILGCYAIPSLVPACYRWEIQPPAGAPVACGLSVPLYGYGGGGVEVEFTRAAINRGQIANPVLLPPF